MNPFFIETIILIDSQFFSIQPFLYALSGDHKYSSDPFTRNLFKICHKVSVFLNFRAKLKQKYLYKNEFTMDFLIR